MLLCACLCRCIYLYTAFLESLKGDIKELHKEVFFLPDLSHPSGWLWSGWDRGCRERESITDLPNNWDKFTQPIVCDNVRCGNLWCGKVRCGKIPCGKVWCGKVFASEAQNLLVAKILLLPDYFVITVNMEFFEVVWQKNPLTLSFRIKFARSK